MVHIRYSRWDARARDSMDANSVFDQLNEYMNDTGDLQQAMRRLERDHRLKKPKGIDDLLQQIAREMRKCTTSTSPSMDRQEWLESIVDQERQTLEKLDQSGRYPEQKQFLNDLPGKTSEAVEAYVIPLRECRRERIPTTTDATGADPQLKACAGKGACFAARRPLTQAAERWTIEASYQANFQACS
jgi:hypothetical protein